MEAERKEKSPDSSDDLLTLARERYEAAYEADQQNIVDSYEDMKFRAGEQWPDEAKRARAERPMLTIDRTSQFVRQVANDIRQMRPGVNVVAVADGASKEVADVIAGLFRYIENRSEAQAAYYRAADFQVAAGMGAVRVEIDYAAASSFEREISITPIQDPIGIVWDSDSILPTREDAEFCFVPVDMSHAAFKKRFPDASLEEFDFAAYGASCWEGWRAEDSVRVAEYWFKAPDVVKLATLANGETIELDEGMDEKSLDAPIVNVEERPTHKVMRALVTVGQVLEEPEEWPGRYIPIVPVIGEEIGIGSRNVRRGLVRPLKDAQRMVNYHASAQVEVTALQPKAPFIGTENNFRANEEIWKRANTANVPFLPYTPDPQTGGQAPQRVQPPVASSGIAEALDRAVADMQAIAGIYPAALGAQSNETSGKAIDARAREADTGTFHYIDNFARAIRYLAKIVVDLIPEVYDAERIVHIIEPDGESKTLSINQPQGLAIDGAVASVANDLTVGVYDVVLQSGPSYSTKREHARDGMMQFMQTMPDAAAAIIDLIAKAQDWPDSQEVKERLELALPPPVQAMLKQKRGEPPDPPPPPPPEVMAEQAKLQQQSQSDQAKFQVDMAKLELEREKLAIERERMSLDGAGALMTHEAAMAQAPPGELDAIKQGLAQTQQAVMQISELLQHVMQAMQGSPPDAGPPMPPDLLPQEPPSGGIFVGEPPAGPPPAI